MLWCCRKRIQKYGGGRESLCGEEVCIKVQGMYQNVDVKNRSSGASWLRRDQALNVVVIDLAVVVEFFLTS